MYDPPAPHAVAIKRSDPTGAQSPGLTQLAAPLAVLLHPAGARLSDALLWSHACTHMASRGDPGCSQQLLYGCICTICAITAHAQTYRIYTTVSAFDNLRDPPSTGGFGRAETVLEYSRQACAQVAATCMAASATPRAGGRPSPSQMHATRAQLMHEQR